MQVSVQHLDPATVQLTIEVDAQAVERAYQKALRLMGRSVRVPGFRPGQAPLGILRQMFPEEQVRRAAGEILVEETLPAAVEQENLQPYRAPHVQIEHLQQGEPFRYKATVPLRPQVQLGEYHDIRFPSPQIETTDAEVESALESMREQLMHLKKVTDRPAQQGDRLVLRMRSLETEDAPAQRYMVVLGQSFGELDNALVNMHIDETKQVTLTFPESFDDPQFAGKTVPVEITLLQIHAPVYPELDDAFAQRFGFENLEQLRESIRGRINDEKHRAYLDEMRNQLLATLRERSTVHLPSTLIEEQLQEEIREFTAELTAKGITLDAFLQHSGATKEQLMEQLRQRGIARLQNTFILLEIAQREGIQPTEEEVNLLLQTLAEEYGQTPQERARIRADQNFRERVRQELILEKALQRLMEQAQNISEGATP